MIELIKIHDLPSFHKSIHLKLTEISIKKVVFDLRNKLTIDDINDIKCLQLTHIFKIDSMYYYVYDNYHLIAFTLDNKNNKDLYNKAKAFDYCYTHRYNKDMLKAYCIVNNLS